MSDTRTLRLYYNDDLLARAEAGEHNYTNRLIAAFARRDVAVKLCRNSDAARALSAGLPGYAMFHMDEPFHPRALTTRLAYLYPFWRIERSAKRWEWEIAQTMFDPDTLDPDAARRFCNRQRRAMFPDLGKPRRGDFVYVPLQGLLLDHRSFQTMSPHEMLGETLAHSGTLTVVAGLHPKEVYSPAERAALDDLAAINPRLTVVEGRMEELLRDCVYVVTQNSSVALSGFFLGKPAILFGQIDFHHIALDVARLGVAACFARVAEHHPDYERYLYWFLKQTTINAGDAAAEDQILDIVRRRGWIF